MPNVHIWWFPILAQEHKFLLLRCIFKKIEQRIIRAPTVPRIYTQHNAGLELEYTVRMFWLSVQYPAVLQHCSIDLDGWGGGGGGG